MKDLLTASLMVIGVTLFLVWIAYIGSAIGCEEKSVSFDDHKYSILSGCMVEKDGKWLPLKNIRDFY